MGFFVFPDEARKCIARAIALFDECQADGYVKQAEQLLELLTDKNGAANQKGYT